MALWLTDPEAAAAVSWSARIDALADALADWSAGTAISGARADYHLLPGDDAARPPGRLLDFRTMFGVWPARRVAALRVVNHTYAFAGGPSPRVAVEPLDDGRIPAFVLVFDAATGRVVAVLPDAVLQRDRVAATAAAGARALARPDARTLGLIGSGRIAEGYVEAIRAVLPLEAVRVFSPSRDHAEALAAAVRESGLDATVADEPREAARADVVCAATSSRAPVLRGAWLEPGTHVVTTNLLEPDPSVLDAADVAVVTCNDRDDGWQLRGADVPVQRERVRALLGGSWGGTAAGGIGPRLAGVPSLGDVLTGAEPGRRSPGEITYHVNQSAGIQFAAIAAAVLAGATELGLGTQLPDELFTTLEPPRLADRPVPAALAHTRDGGSCR